MTTQQGNDIFVETDMSLEKTLFCGQAFRFKRKEENCFEGVAKDRYIELIQLENGIVLKNTSQEEYDSFWKTYFDMDRDYVSIDAAYTGDAFLKIGMEYAKGMRILRQDVFETLISFIISANNNVLRISGIIERICNACGKEIQPEIHAFPTVEELASLKQEDFETLGAGYRSAYLYKTAQMLLEKNELHTLVHMGYDAAIEELTKFMGVGRKVADCIALFSLGYMQAFPLDVWMKRVVFDVYGLDKKSDVYAFIAEKFGEYAGIAQQYLFYYAKSVKINK